MISGVDPDLCWSWAAT